MYLYSSSSRFLWAQRNWNNKKHYIATRLLRSRLISKAITCNHVSPPDCWHLECLWYWLLGHAPYMCMFLLCHSSTWSQSLQHRCSAGNIGSHYQLPSYQFCRNFIRKYIAKQNQKILKSVIYIHCMSCQVQPTR